VKIIRDPDCPSYNDCLTEAAKKNFKLDCRSCDKKGKIPLETNKGNIQESMLNGGRVMEKEESPNKLKEIKTKVCKKYGPPHEKLLTEFSKNLSTPDGLERSCKTCISRYRNEMKNRRNKKEAKADSKESVKKSVPLPSDMIQLEAQLIQGVRKALRKEFAQELIDTIRERFEI
jgi:hypothetical protein